MSAWRFWVELSHATGERLIVASLAVAVAGSLAFVLSRLLPQRAARLRAALWWLVAVRGLLELAGAPGLPLLPARSPAPPAAVSDLGTIVVTGLEPVEYLDAAAIPRTAPARAETSRWPPSVSRATLVATGGALWWIGCGASLLIAASSFHRGRRLLARTRPVRSPEVLRALGRARSRLGVRARVALVESSEVDTFALTGFVRPTIVVPRSAPSRLLPGDLELAFAHELAHLVRRDLWIGLVPALAERLLFFHPLARLAAREYSLARESACDLEVVERFRPTAERYGSLLVRLASGRAGRTRHLAAALPLARHPLARRLQMLATAVPSGPAARAAGAIVLGLALINAMPLRTGVPEPPELPPSAAAPEAPPEPEAPATTEAPPTPAVGVRPVAPAPPPSEPVRPSAAVPPAPRTPPAGWRGSGEAWILWGEGNRHWSLDAGEADRRRADRSRAGDEPLLFYRDGDEAWTVRSPEILDRFDRLMSELDPGVELADLSEEIAARVAARQEELAAALERQAAEMAALAESLARRHQAAVEESVEKAIEALPEIEREQASLEEGLDAAVRAQLEARLAALPESLADLESRGTAEARERMGKLERQLAELASERRLDLHSGTMEDLERRLAETRRELDARQREITRRARALLREAIERGLAEPAP
ncbi:MAG: hypothetical protein KDB94_14140 [Acidobacteria bacterium]|nr:hypothetical protein [Acidobacteriota bacterium]